MIDVVSVRPIGGFKLEIEFSDGTVGVRDFSFVTKKTGSMAQPLKDPAYFARVFIDDGALTWPNGYDWDPIALHEDMKAEGLLRRADAAE
jgi:hypothetical protein